MPYTNTGFSECLLQIMESRGLSVSEFARVLNLKSKTTVVRVLHNTAGERSILNFRNVLVNSRELALTSEELQKLDDSIFTRKNETAYSIVFEELWALLCRRETLQTDIRVLGSERYDDLNEFGRGLKNTDVECLIVNCGFLSFVESAGRFLGQMENGRSVSVSQYFYNSDDYPRRLVRMIGRILPLLAHDCYMAYTISKDTADGCFDLHAAAIRCGTGEEYELLFCNEKTVLLTEGKDLYRKWQAFLETFRVSPIKSVKDTGVYNYIGFMDHYRKLEEKRTVYKLRPDLCVNCIPEPNLKAAFLDGCEAHGIFVPEDTVAALVDVHRRRYSNIDSKRQTTHLVVSAKAMRRFAETGRHSDHLYTMRPYTFAERREILQSCLDRMEKNPRFHLYLLTERTEERIYANAHPVEMVCYEGNCVQLTPALTDYNFRKGHSEIFIEQEAFLKLFVDFFMNDLVQYHTQPEEETKKLLCELIHGLGEK